MDASSQIEFDRRLRVFRARVDLRPCQPAEGAPYWVSAVCGKARNDFGVLALLGPTGVRVADGETPENRASTRYLPDPAAVGLAGLIAAARQDGLSLSIACPPVGRHIPLLFVATTALAQTIEQQGRRGGTDGKGILIVSTDLDVRSRYCDFQVGNLQIEDAHPGSRLRPTGDRVSLTAGRDASTAGGVCFYLPRGALPSKIDFKPALVILDLRYAKTNPLRVDELIEWVRKIRNRAGVVALHSFGDSDTAAKLVRGEFAHFALDHRSISTLSEAIRTDGLNPDVAGLELHLSGAQSFLQREHHILEVPNAHIIEDLFGKVGALLDENKAVENADLNRARWILATLRQLPVPMPWYEQTAYSAGRQTLRALIGRIGILSRHERLGATLQSLRLLFELVYREIERANPRTVYLERHLPHLVGTSGRALLLVRDKTTQRALRTWVDLEGFRGASWTERIDVVACPDYARFACTRYERAVIISGVFPRRHRWIVGSALAKEVFFLAYPHEVDVVEQQLRPFFDPKELDRLAAQRNETVAKICHTTVPTGADGTADGLPDPKPSQEGNQIFTDRSRRFCLTFEPKEFRFGDDDIEGFVFHDAATELVRDYCPNLASMHKDIMVKRTATYLDTLCAALCTTTVFSAVYQRAQSPRTDNAYSAAPDDVKKSGAIS